MTANGEILQRGEEVFTPAFHFYHRIAIRSGRGNRITDVEGNSYLDWACGLGALNIGHGHPRVVERVQRQIPLFVHTGGVYRNETTVEAAEMLLSVAPEGLERLFFSNSGAEAVEGAIKLARHVSGRQGIIAFGGSFHGRTLGALSLTSSNSRYRERYHPLLPSVFHSPYPYCFHCPFSCRPSGCSMACFAHLEEMLRRYITPGDLAAIIIEPVLGEGGYVPAPAPFLASLRRLCDQHGILLIFDEVQSGMGRCGDWFASQCYGITPDIMAVAKGIASGFPLSAVVARKELMAAWPTWAHGTTFGGNPVSCAASLATMETIRDEGLLQSCRSLGGELMARLEELKGRYPLIGDVRGMGLMIGVELVQGDGSPDAGACERILAECLGMGLVVINCGPERNILRLIPSLTTSDQELEEGVEILSRALDTVADGQGAGRQPPA